MTPQRCTAVHRNQGSDPPNRAGAGESRFRALDFRRRRPVLLAEFIDAAAGIHNFLLARVERMAIGANFDLQIMADGRAGLELIAAGTSDCDDFIFGMDAGFHRNLDKSNGRIDEPAKGAHRHALMPYRILARPRGRRLQSGRSSYPVGGGDAMLLL